MRLCQDWNLKFSVVSIGSSRLQHLILVDCWMGKYICIKEKRMRRGRTKFWHAATPKGKCKLCFFLLFILTFCCVDMGRHWSGLEITAAFKVYSKATLNPLVVANCNLDSFLREIVTQTSEFLPANTPDGTFQHCGQRIYQ